MTGSGYQATDSEEDLEAFVEEALSYVRDVGEKDALEEFCNISGRFVRGNLYIYAYDFQGINLAHPVKPEFVGKSLINLTDSNGVTPTRSAIDVARRGKGLFYLVFPNPAHDGRDELKLGSVAAVSDEWWLGSGTYLSDVPCFFPEEDRVGLVAFVDEALNYTRVVGQEEALKAFNDPEGEFVRKDLYIFAYDLNGTTLALPFQPEILGQNRMGLEDANGVAFIRDMVDLAGRGGGYTYYLYPDPARKMAPRLKLSYVVKAEGDWFLGAGIYEAQAVQA